MFQKKLKLLLLTGSLLGTCLLGGCGNSGSPSGEASAEAPENVEESTAQTEQTYETLPQGLSAVYTVSTDASVLDASYEISDTLYGIFVEDINHALDGGMYAELVKNRSFEYGNAAANQSRHGWSTTDASGELLTFEVVDGSEDSSALHEQNPHYARLTNASEDYLGIYTKGYLEGMSVTLGEEYTFSVYIRNAHGYDASVRVSLQTGADGTPLAEEYIEPATEGWGKYTLSLTPHSDTLPNGTVTEDEIRLAVEITQGTLELDMVSLLPADTYAGLPIRKDIGEMLKALNPSFIRFPGGCVIEGRDEESMYSWKDSIGNGAELTVDGVTTTGDIAVRPQGRSIWSGTNIYPYYTTYGIGFYEFFELCETLDCLPVPVLNAGMTCQVQSPRYIVYDMGGEEFQQCIQDALDLVEFCRGDSSTYWGGVRIAMGHEEPFRLEYIAIGNEQWQSEYFQHYRKFAEAFNQAAQENPEMYGDIQLIVANSTSSGDRVGWNYVEDAADFGDERTTLVDEHYYEAPSFFFTNTNRYDRYDRNSQAKVFLGEYAAQSNTLEAALAEAAYMTGLEKNGDVVQMACYAPLFGNKTQVQWTPDMIWYSQSQLFGSVNYYVQQLFSNNKGVTNLPASLEVSGTADASGLSGAVGLGSWQTSVAYDNLVITDNATGEVLYSNDFDSEDSLNDFDIHEGDWALEDGRLVQYNTDGPDDVNTGDALYVGDKSWSSYTLTVEGEILEGPEGFLIPVCVQNTNNNIFWNIGGWANSVACLQIVSGGSKSGQINGTVHNLTLTHNKVYTIKVVVDGNHIEGYLNDMKYLDYTQVSASPLYETASVDENGDIILKIINTTDMAGSIQTSLESFDASAYESTATVTVLSGSALSDTNSFQQPDKMVPVETSVEVSESFTYEAPAYSVSIIRIEKK